VRKLKLQGRERTVVIVGMVAVLAIVLLQLGRGPWRKYRQSEANLVAARRRLEEVQDLRRFIAGQRKEQEAFNKLLRERGGRFDLYTYISGILNEKGLRERGASLETERISPSPDMALVEMGLQGVSLEELVDVLHAIYAGESLVALYKLDRLTAAQDQKGLNCTMTFISPRG